MPATLSLTSGPLTIRPLQYGNGLALAGEADVTAQPALAAALATLPAEGSGEVYLDLAALDFIDVACARELIRFAGRHRGARVIVRQPPECLRRIAALLSPCHRLKFTGNQRCGHRRERLAPLVA